MQVGCLVSHGASRVNDDDDDDDDDDDQPSYSLNRKHVGVSKQLGYQLEISITP